MPRYLLCPQCGSHRYFVKPLSGSPSVYFYVTAERQPVPTEMSHTDLHDHDFSAIACCGCSWQGGLHKLVTRFPAS